MQVHESKSLGAMLTFVQLAGVTPEGNLRNPLQADDKAHRRGISGSTERTFVLQKLYEKKQWKCRTDEYFWLLLK